MKHLGRGNRNSESKKKNNKFYVYRILYKQILQSKPKQKIRNEIMQGPEGHTKMMVVSTDRLNRSFE